LRSRYIGEMAHVGQLTWLMRMWLPAGSRAAVRIPSGHADSVWGGVQPGRNAPRTTLTPICTPPVATPTQASSTWSRISWAPSSGRMPWPSPRRVQGEWADDSDVKADQDARAEPGQLRRAHPRLGL